MTFRKVLEHRGALIATILVGSGLLLTGAALYWIYLSQDDLPVLKGQLYPADESTPPNPCRDSVSEHDLVVLLGANAVKADRFPLSIINVQGQDRLVLDREDDGSIVISLDIVNDDGSISIRIIKGEFTIPQTYIPQHQKDRNSFGITDFAGTQILKMRYLNNHTLWIDAILRYQGLDGAPVIFSGSSTAPTDIGITDTQIRRHCYQNSGIALLNEE